MVVHGSLRGHPGVAWLLQLGTLFLGGVSPSRPVFPPPLLPVAPLIPYRAEEKERLLPLFLMTKAVTGYIPS
jgi:hypothetical protein